MRVHNGCPICNANKADRKVRDDTLYVELGGRDSERDLKTALRKSYGKANIEPQKAIDMLNEVQGRNSEWDYQMPGCSKCLKKISEFLTRELSDKSKLSLTHHMGRSKPEDRGRHVSGE